MKLFFFLCQYFKNKRFLFFQLRIPVAALGNYRTAQAGQKRSLYAEHPSMSGCPPDQTAQDITAPFVRRHNAVRYHKCSGTDMICNQPNRHIVRLAGLISLMRQFAYFITNRFHRIDIKDRVRFLHHNRKPLQTHPCIDVFLRKLLVISFAVTVKLRKYIIPYFHKTIAVTARLTIRAAAAIRFSAIIIDLGTRPARPCAMLPEIVAFSVFIPIKSCDLLLCNADLFVPDFKRFFVFAIDRRIQAVFGKTEYVCQKLPRPCDGFFLKIVAKRKIAEHLKKSQMSCGLSHIFNISGTNTFLTGRNALFRRYFLSCKIWFQRSHPCVNQQQAVVVMWY